jgi:flagellar motor switch protein FliM
MDTRNGKAAAPAAKSGDHLFSDEEDGRERKISAYDFRKPGKFSSEQLTTVRMIHDTFARLISASLSARLGLLTHARVSSVDQLTYEEFIRGIPSPATLSVIAMEPLKGTAVLEIDPVLAFAMIDRLFGGTGGTAVENRDLTDIEASLMETAIGSLLGCLGEAWANVIDLRPRLSAIETCAQFTQIVPPNEMAILVSLDTRITGTAGETAGWINFCIPYLTIEPLIGKLSAQYWYTSAAGARTGEPVESVGGLKLDACLYHLCGKLSLKELSRLRKGSRIRLPGYASGETYLETGCRTIMKLRREKGVGKKGLQYIVEQGDFPFADLRMENKERERESALAGMTRAISSGLKTGFDALSEEIGHIRKKQDELAEQLYFNGQAKDRQGFDGPGRGEDRPFGFISTGHLDFLALSLPQEHPQTIALILSYLPPELAAQILSRFDEELRVELAKRIAGLERTAPESLHACERVLRVKLETLHAGDIFTAGGIAGIVNILNATPRNVEKQIIEALEASDAPFAENIKQRMFVFEDITLLDGKTVKKIIQGLDREVLAVALMKTIPEVKSLINGLLTEDERAEILGIQEAKSPQRILDIEDSQKRIVDRIRVLEEGGEIVVARPGETV